MTASPNVKETKNTDKLNTPKGVESVTRIIAAPKPNITGEITNMDTLVSCDKFTFVVILMAFISSISSIEQARCCNAEKRN